MGAFFVILPVIIVLGTVITRVFAFSDVQSTKKKFAALGRIAGRTKAEIIEAVGPPSSISSIAGGKTLLQWQHITSGGGYHIALRFNADDICEGITHQHSSRV